MNLIELTLEEYNAIWESRCEICAEAINESLFHGTTKEFGEEFKQLISEFKKELTVCKNAIKDNDKEKAKSSIKKLNSMLDDIEQKVKDAPEDDKETILVLVKTIGIDIITGLASVLGIDVIGNKILANLKAGKYTPDPNILLKDNDKNKDALDYIKTHVKNLPTNIKKYTKDVEDKQRKYDRDMKIMAIPAIAGSIILIINTIYHIIKMIKVSKDSMIMTIQMYKKQLNKLSDKINSIK